jgi:hypothetical protein
VARTGRATGWSILEFAGIAWWTILTGTFDFENGQFECVSEQRV